MLDDKHTPQRQRWVKSMHPSFKLDRADLLQAAALFAVCLFIMADL